MVVIVVEVVVEVEDVEKEVEVVVMVIDPVVVTVGLNVVLVEKSEGVVTEAIPILPAAGVESKPTRESRTISTSAKSLLNSLNALTS